MLEDEEQAELASSATEQTAEASADEAALEGPATAEGGAPAPSNDWPPFPAEGEEDNASAGSAPDEGSETVSGAADSSETDSPDDRLEPGMARLEGNIIE
jgi:hypothetical protein